MHRLTPSRSGFPLLLALALLAGCGEREYDDEFDTRVESPTYTDAQPRVLFDEAHHNRHTSRTGYRPFVELLRSDGYRVDPGEQALTLDLLRPYQVLVIVGAMGLDDEGDDPAFTPAEVAAVERWVRSGGALLLVADHYPFSDAAAGLAERFGVSFGRGFTEDSVHFDRSTKDRSQLVFSRENGLLADHPITRGRNTSERIDRVATFTGTSLRGPDGSVLLRLGTSAIDYRPSVTVQRAGGDTRVQVSYEDPRPSQGNAQGLALAVGRGRVVVMGEAAALTAQRSRYDGARIGMNLPGFDNRQFALNVMHWLSRAPGMAQ